MTDDRGVVEQALDYLVYAPLGLVLEAREMIPKLADRGRGQMALARVAGRFAAQRGQDEARRVVDGLLKDTEPSAASDTVEARSVDRPFEGYDDLDAKQVISRAADMSADELDGVLAYELDQRGRSTIISRVRQLRA